MTEKEQKYDNIREKLTQSALDSWKGGNTGQERADKLNEFLDNMLDNYSEKLGFSREDILIAIESKRTYSAINYYQRSNFPLLDDKVYIINSTHEYKRKFPSKKFICPHCEGISTDPQICDSGKIIEYVKDKSVVCDWKSFGLFGTLGKGINLVIKKDFLNDGIIHHIFKPIELDPSKQNPPAGSVV